MVLQMPNNVLFISDLHCPYHHPDAFQFLKALSDKYKFDRVVCVGDELDYHAMAFHDHDPDLANAGEELQMGREALWELNKLFPKMDLVESNHGSMAYRKGVYHGIPRHLILDYRDVIFGEKDKRGSVYRPKGRGDGWTWHPNLVFSLGKQKVLVVHGRSVSTRRNVEQAGMCFVQGHHHGTMELVYHGTEDFLNWGMSTGCLIDDSSVAFAYNRNSIRRPVIGCGGIVNNLPRLFPMILNHHGRWNGVVP